MTIRVADKADLAIVVELRMRLFSEFHHSMSMDEQLATQDANREFFEQHLDSSTSRTWVGEVNGQVVAAGTLAFFVRPPHPGNLAGKEAYLLNMYTLPEYRRQGLARGIVSAAISYAESQGIKRIWLHAAEAGRGIYESASFRGSENYMELKLA